jgi:uncharacterized protein (DUF362 family)
LREYGKGGNMEKMSRRQFIWFMSAAGVCTWMGTTHVRAQEGMDKPIRDWGPLPERVFQSKIEKPPVVGTSHSHNPYMINIEQLVREAVEKAGGLDKVIHAGDTVLIKPNLVTNVSNGTGITTDVRVAEAVARMALDCGAKKIVFAEGSSTNIGQAKYSKEVTQRCFLSTGYTDLAERMGATVIDLNHAGKTPGGRELVRNVDLKYGLKKKSYWIAKRFFDADCVISVPVLKTHTYAGVTLSLKNYIGIAPADIYQAPAIAVPASKFGLDHSTFGLARHIVDLVMIRPPDYVVIDALIGLGIWQRHRPLAGPKGPMRAVIAGRDPVAVDTVACLAMNYEPKTIGHLVLASAVGLGASDPKEIAIRGAGIEPFRQDFPIPVSEKGYRPDRYGL